MLPSLVLFAVLGLMQEFDADKVARIEREQARETAAVQAKFGNRKSTELTPEERSQMIRDLALAEGKVLEKYGVDRRDWAKTRLNRTREQALAVKHASQALDEQEKSARPATAPLAEPREIAIQRGISDENPVILEQKDDAPPIVEHGESKEYEADRKAAAEHDEFEKAGETPAKPAAKGGKTKSR